MRTKFFENKHVRKGIVWAMTFMMTFSAIGSNALTLTVQAAEAPTEGEIIKESSAVTEAADDVAAAAQTAADSAEAAKEAAADAETAAKAAEALVDAIYGTEETEEAAAVPGIVSEETATDDATGETTTKVVANVNEKIDAADKAIDKNNTAVDAADDDITKIEEAATVTEEKQAAKDDASDKATKAKDAQDEARDALEAVLAATPDSEEGNQEAAIAAKELAKNALDQAKAAEKAAKEVKETAEADAAAAQAAYDDLALQLKAIEDADATAKLEEAKAELEAAQQALADAEAAYKTAMNLSTEANIVAKEADAVNTAIAKAEGYGKAASEAVVTIKDKLATVKENASYEELVTGNDDAIKAYDDAVIAKTAAEEENQPKITQANSELNGLNNEKATLEGKKANLVALKNEADATIKDGDDWHSPFKRNIDHYREIESKKAGEWKIWLVEKYTQKEIDAAKEYVAKYEQAKTDSATYKGQISAKDDEINAKNTEIAEKEAEIASYQKNIDDATAAVNTAETNKAVAATRLAAVDNFLYDGDAESYEMTEEEKAEYDRLVAELNASAQNYTTALGDTIRYIDATNDSVFQQFVGLFTGETWKKLSTELKLESKYHDEKWYGTDGSCYVLKTDGNNSKFLIAMTNGKYIVSKVDEMEAAAFKASFDALVATNASSVAATELQKEADALAKYAAAKKAVEEAQAKYDALVEIKSTEATLAKAQDSLDKAIAAKDAAVNDYNTAVADRKLTENYYNWAKTLADTQVTRIYARKTEDGIVAANDFDQSDSTVASQKPVFFDEVTKGAKGAVKVPYEMMHAYISYQYGKTEGNYNKIKNGTGISVGSIQETEVQYEDGTVVKQIDASDATTLSQLFWVMDENSKVEKDATPMTLAELIEKAKEEALKAREEEGADTTEDFEYEFVSDLLLGYTFKHEADGYHIDGVLYKLKVVIPADPKQDTVVIVTPSGGGGGGGRTGGGRGAGDVAGDVLGARRDQEALVESGEVLGAARAPKTSDSAKAILWMLVMGTSALGAAAILASRKKES